MINCYHPNCDICKEKNCILKKTLSKELMNVKKEIAFELMNLKNIRKSLNLSLQGSGEYFVDDVSILLEEEADTVEIIRELRKMEMELSK